MKTDKLILDACCGPRMMWFDKQNPLAVFMDIRDEECTLCDGRNLEVHPDVVGDFRNMPFEDATFRLVVFDPRILFALEQIATRRINMVNYSPAGKQI